MFDVRDPEHQNEIEGAKTRYTIDSLMTVFGEGREKGARWWLNMEIATWAPRRRSPDALRGRRARAKATIITDRSRSAPLIIDLQRQTYWFRVVVRAKGTPSK